MILILSLFSFIKRLQIQTDNLSSHKNAFCCIIEVTDLNMFNTDYEACFVHAWQK